MRVELWVGVDMFELDGWVEFVPGLPPQRIEKDGRLVGFSSPSRGAVHVVLTSSPAATLQDLHDTTHDGVLVEWGEAIAFTRARFTVDEQPPGITIVDRPCGR